MILLVGLLAVLPVVYAVTVVLANHRRDARLRALCVRDILQHIHAVLQNPKAPVVLAHQNKTTAGAIFSGRNFFCDCMWPVSSSGTVSSDDGSAILRSLDGYLGFAEKDALRERLEYFGVHAERDATLKFLIQGDAGRNAAVRKQHGICYKVDAEHASGDITPVIYGVLPRAILEDIDDDELLEDIFAVLQSYSKS